MYRDVAEELERKLRDPEFAREYEALKPESQVAREVIRLRQQRRCSQKELAARLGTGQSAISRLENFDVSPTVRLLARVADALDADLEIRFIPKEPVERHRQLQYAEA